MARIFSIGFELAHSSLGDNYPLAGGTPHGGTTPGRTGKGRAYVVSRPVGSYYVQGGNPAGTQYVTQYERFYIRIGRIPTTGSCRIWSNFTDLGGNSLKLDLKTDGTLELWNVARSLGVTAALSLDTWYRIEIKGVCNTAAFSAPDPPFEDNSTVEVKIDGVTVLNVIALNSGLALTGMAARNCKVYRSYIGAEGVTADAEYELDDWVADSADWPGAGQVTQLRVTAQGTYAEFTGDWRRVSWHPGPTAPTTWGITSSTASKRSSYTVEAFADRGITGTINAISIGAFVWTLGLGPDLGLRVNGIDNWNAVATGFNVWRLHYLPNPGVTIADTLEVGFRKGADANAGYCCHLSLLIDHDSPDPAAETDTTIRTEVGSYVGDGVGQTVPLTFEPDFLLIRPIGAIGTGCLWHRAMGFRGGYPSGPDGAGIETASTRLSQVGATGFDVGASTVTNAVGVTYWFLAIRDRTGRMMVGEAFMPTAADNIDIAITPATFTPDVLLVGEQFPGGAAANLIYRDPAYVGDLSSDLAVSSGAPAANMIQSVGAGTFQIGTVLTTAYGQRFFIGFKTGVFVQNKLLAVGSYVGTGIGAGGERDIALNFGGLTPVFALVIPHAAGTSRYCRTDQNAAQDSQNFVTGAVQATYALKALAADSIKIGFILDALGVTHSVLAFTNGSDALPDVTEETFPDPWSGETVPLLWAELALDTGTYVYAKVDLPDPATYYGGYKEARILTAGAIKRALSDRMGNYEAAQFDLTLSDADRQIRGLLGSAASKWILNRFVTLRMISDEYRRLLRIPKVVGIGYLRDYAPISPLQFAIACEDYLAIFVGLGQNEKQIPKRTITADDFDGCPEATLGKPVPICYGDLSDAQSDEGPVQNVQATEVLIGSPVANLAGVENTGGTLVNGTSYEIQVTAVGDDGKEYDPSPAITVAVGVGGSQTVYDATITPPEMMGMHHLNGAGTITAYRWGLVTALVNVGGVWHESDPGGWGDVHGDVDPNLAANCMMAVRGTPDRVRFYLFNVNDFSALGFHPTRNPDCPVGVDGDPVTPKIVRIVEADLAGVVYSAKTGGRVDADYFGPGTTSPWGDVTGEGITHYANLYSDADGDDFYAAAVGGQIDLTWDAWTPPAGVTLDTYRVYYNDGSGWRYFDEAGTAVSITAPDQGESVAVAAYVYAVTGVFGGDQTVPSAEAVGRSGVRVISPGIRVTWNALQDADAYYVYRRNRGATGLDAPLSAELYDRRWPVTGKTSFIDDLLDTGVELIDGIPKAQGILPVIYVGDVTLAGQAWRKFLVCGHAVKAIVAVYQKDDTDDEYLVIPPGDFGPTFLAPGFAGWATYFATDYADVNGRRYTFIYARGPLGEAAADGSQPIRVNLRGIEDVGDGSGTLITDGFAQYLHAMRNWILQDYQTGAWFADGPAWPDSFGLGTTEVLDDDSFTDAAAVAAVRITGGYAGAFVMGANETQDTVRDWIQRFNLSLDAFAGFNRKSQFFVRLIDTSATVLAAARKFTQIHDIVAESFKVIDKPTDLENVVAYVFGRNYATGGWKYDTRTVSDPESITKVLQEKKSQTIELWTTDRSAQALDVAGRRLLRTKETPRTVIFQSGLQAINVELGDVVLVTHLEGIGSGGWTDRPVFVTRHELDPDGLTVTLEGIDVERLFAGAFILGDDTALVADWATALTADRAYGYLCDETTELFSDGAAGKRLR